MSRTEVVHVVVPARNEAALIGRCLRAVDVARTRLLAQRPDLQVRVTVVLDGCVDDTASVVRRFNGVDAVQVEELTPGGARAAGVRRVLALAADTDPARVWVACTDADSEVPPGWLVAQVDCATRGFACRVGSVQPELEPADRALSRRWTALHAHPEGHEHVYGADLGFALDAYEQVGGFAPLACGEDVDLVRRLRAAGVSVLATGEQPVLTSGRRTSRVRGGFADYLANLSVDVAGAS